MGKKLSLPGAKDGRAPSAHLYGECPDGQKSFKIYSKSNRIFAYA